MEVVIAEQKPAEAEITEEDAEEVTVEENKVIVARKSKLLPGA